MRDRTARLVLAGIITSAAFTGVALGGDWPMQRHDAARSGISPDELPSRLGLHWTWRLPKRNAVFSPDRRSRIDGSYDATVVGRTLHLGCEYNDSVVAIDTRTGREKWRFYAEGAVRFSPAVWKGRLYFGADDGRLYCLNAADGKLRWRFDGAPSNRKIINHERIASNWLATGGAVVANGVVNFSCGAWPLDGVCAYGVNAETGKLVWRHDTWNTISNGYLSIEDGQLPLRVGTRGSQRLQAATGKLVTAGKGGRTGLHWRKARDLWQAADKTALPDGVKFPAGWDPYYAIAQAGRQVFGAGMLWRKGMPNAVHGLVGIAQSSRGDKPRVFFARQFDSRILDTVCADDRLFVMTQNGGVYCFGAARSEEAKELVLPEPRYSDAKDGWAQRAVEILSKTGQTEGLCLVWGLDDGRLVEELLRQSKLQICAVDPDEKKVNALRRKLDSAGLYRGRLQLYVGAGAEFGFPPYIANLIVSETHPTSGAGWGESFARAVFRSLRPYGGTACFELDQAGRAQFEQALAKVKPSRGEVRKAGPFTMLVRQGALAGAADWTHEMRDAANTLCAPDTVMRAPMSVLWFGGPAGRVGMTYQEMLPPGPIVVGGRYIMQGPDKLTAIDIYTGRQMWQVDLPKLQHNATVYGKSDHAYPAPLEGEIPVGHTSRGTGLNMVAADDAICVVAGSRCLVIDTATGKTTKTLAMPLSHPGISELCWGRLFIEGDLIIATAFDPAVVRACFPGWRNTNEKNKDRLPMMYILAVNRFSGKVVWKRKAATAFNSRALAIGRQKVFCIDSLTPAMSDTLKAAGRSGQKAQPRVMAIEAKTGRLVWSKPIDIVSTKITYAPARDALILPSREPLRWKGDRWVATSPGEAKKGSKTPGAMVALRGRDGGEMWRVADFQYGEPVMIRGETIITRHGVTFDLADGQPARRTNVLTGAAETWHAPKGGCNFMVGSGLLVTSRTRYYDAAHHSGQTVLAGMRSGCTPSIIPAGGVMGLLNYSSHSSDPYRSAVAFVHDPETVNWKAYVPSRDKRPLARPARIALNLAAPGDHAESSGAIWFAQGLSDPKRKGRPGNAGSVGVKMEGNSLRPFSVHPLRLTTAPKGPPRFIACCGFEGVESLRVSLGPETGKAARYTVRLHFCEPAPVRPGDRVFNVSLQGREALNAFDIARIAGCPLRAVVQEFPHVEADDEIHVHLTAGERSRPPLLSGIEVVQE